MPFFFMLKPAVSAFLHSSLQPQRGRIIFDCSMDDLKGWLVEVWSQTGCQNSKTKHLQILCFDLGSVLACRKVEGLVISVV